MDVAQLADGVTKVLSVGASGFAVVLAFMSFRLIQQAPGGDSPQDLEIYRSRLQAGNRFLVITLVFFVLGLLGQYFLEARRTTLQLVVQESRALEKFNRDFKIEPIRIMHGVLQNEIPTKKGADRLELILRGDDKVDISIDPLVEYIRQQDTLIRAKDRQIADRTRQGGFDEAH